MINVTRSFMPPFEEYENYIKTIWENRHLTNEGPLLKKLVGLIISILKMISLNKY